MESSVTQPVQSANHKSDKTWFWLAVVVMGTRLGELAFHTQTRTTPNAASVIPIPFAIVLVGFVAMMASRERGLVRIALAFFSLGLLVPVLGLLGLAGWSAWLTRSALMWTSAVLLIVDFRRSMGVRLVVVAAAVLLVLTLSYGTQRFGYELWLRARGQNSVMAP
jgi:hypothetical protein